MNDFSPRLRFLVYAALVLGSLLFSFPFAWMVLTSVKQQGEMTQRRLRLLPRAPVPAAVSPYVDGSEFRRPSVPEGIPARAWEAVAPALAARLDARIAAWIAARPPSSAAALLAPGQPRGALVAAMRNGALEAVSERLSDRLRLAASAAARSAPSLQAWRDEVVEASDRIVGPDRLDRLADQCLRAVCLGAVRVQLDDGRTLLFTGLSWAVAGGKGSAASLQPVWDGTALSYRLDPGGEAALSCEIPLVGVPPGSVRSLFLDFRSDESWAAASAALSFGGRDYRAARPFHLWGSDWREEEFRFPSQRGDFTGRRAYIVLREEGGASVPDAPAVPSLRLTLAVHRVGPLEAWGAKIALNYQRAGGEVPLLRFLATSTSLVLLNVVLMIFSCTLAGYAFARLEWPGRDLFFAVLLATMMIPAQVTMIPRFLIVKHLGWFGTLLPLWVPAFFGAPFYIFLVRQFLRNVPRDLEEAASIDGCGFLRVYWHVMLPLVKPTVASIAIFTFIGSWNDFLGPLIYLNDERLYPLALGLFRFNLTNTSETGLLMAASLIMSLPVIVMFFFLQRFFIRGLAISGTKE